MSVGISEPEEISPVAGIEISAVSAGIKNSGHTDMVVFHFDESASCAATFTKNAFCAAPVILAKSHLSQTRPRALLINSGNANAGTGDTGMQNAEQSCRWLADELQCSTEQVLPFSTGVIGQQLPMSAVRSGIEKIRSGLSDDNWLAAAKGIMTTDTVAKAVSKTIILDGQEITISGIAKGSGMICPNMATMLAFIATDADIEDNYLQRCLLTAVEGSFNSITVDGDTSTNDACVLVATAKAENKKLDKDGADADLFTEALQSVCQHLAQSIIRDGEGATKFVTVSVIHAVSSDEAKDVAYTVANSPLVKTALFASDPNWGRILAAVGRSAIEQLDITGVNIFLGDVCIVSAGGVDENYSEEQGQAVMDEEEISITIELNRGSAAATVWTSDLSYDYVRINAEYRT